MLKHPQFFLLNVYFNKLKTRTHDMLYIKKNSILIKNETVKNKVSERLKSPKFSKFSPVKFLPKSEKAMMDDEK